MDAPNGFVATAVPSRLADLGLSFVRPAGWVLVDLPAETPDFAKPASFAPLAVTMAPYAPIVFSVVARPAYEDGTLVQWLEFLAHDQGFDPGSIEHETFFRHPAVACWAMQQSDGVLLRMRLVLFEDGGRMVQVSAMAPQPLWNSMHDTLRTMLASFTLLAPRGGTVALAPAGRELPATTYGLGAIVAPPAAPAAPKEPDEPVVTHADDPAPPEQEQHPETEAVAPVGDDELDGARGGIDTPATPATVAPDPDSGPEWWRDALQLERRGELEAAERRILKAIDHLGAPAQVAHLYELRGNRLRSLGDEDGAQVAYEASGEWMDRMAAGATSGGEGAALSLQRDEHRARLGLRPFGEE